MADRRLGTADWAVDFATTVDVCGEPWACLLRVGVGSHRVYVELENHDGQWTATIVKAEGGERGN